VFKNGVQVTAVRVPIDAGTTTSYGTFDMGLGKSLLSLNLGKDKKLEG